MIRESSSRWFLLLSVLLFACGGLGSRGSSGPTTLPNELLVGEGSGPALFVGPEADAVAVGYVSPGVRVTITGTIERGRVPVSVGESLRARGYLDITRLVAYVTADTALAGTAVVLPKGSLVSLLADAGGGTLRVRADVPVGRDDADEPTLGVFEGTIAAALISDTPETAPRSRSRDQDDEDEENDSDEDEVDADEEDADESPRSRRRGGRDDEDEDEDATPRGMKRGKPRTLPEGREVKLYASASAERENMITKLPELDPPLQVEMLERGSDDTRGWYRIRVGAGPFLEGWVKARLARTDSEVSTFVSPSVSAVVPVAAGQLPERIARETERPLYSVREGARLRYSGSVIGRFKAPGYAREVERKTNGDIEAFVAVDNGLALRGLLRARDVQALPAPATVDAAAAATVVPVASPPAADPASPGLVSPGTPAVAPTVP